MPSKQRPQIIPLHVIQCTDKSKAIFPYKTINFAFIKYGLAKQKSEIKT